MVWASMAPLVMGRLLFVIIPLLDHLGPLLTTIQAMIIELLIFVIPWGFITAGFAISLQGECIAHPAVSPEATPLKSKA